MPRTEFSNPLLLPNGDLRVSGPFDAEHARLLGDVNIRFLLIQKGAADHDPPVIVDGVATWKDGQKDWETTIPADEVPRKLRGGGTRIRGAGVAVAVRRAEADAPPAFETYTWCVTKVVEGGAAAA